MADPYRISSGTEQTPPATRADGGGLLRPLLWVVLIVSAVANGVSSIVGLPVLVGAGFGLLTLACVAALIVHHYRHRRG
ncbi:hypothetical protein ACN27G_06930 [Plantactinospora sp. WMMB334]|uniref:hypothetical protein n=1 Tax=Plantactinospora sp. WMMB334 TaxID=3404119 RepID=UPI003B9501CA